jgi:hypothetical protein
MRGVASGCRPGETQPAPSKIFTWRTQKQIWPSLAHALLSGLEAERVEYLRRELLVGDALAILGASGLLDFIKSWLVFSPAPPPVNAFVIPVLLFCDHNQASERVFCAKRSTAS